MVDFRYHLVSIIAVFLALAVGIVVGTTALKGPVLDDLRDNIKRLSSDKRTLEGDVGNLRGQVRAADDFAAGVGPGLVRGALADQRVLLVTTPETPSDVVDRLTVLLGQAGAGVTGRLRLLPQLSEPDQSQLVDDLVAQVIPAGVDLPDGEPVEQATAELAAALVRPSSGAGVEVAEAQAVVSAFEEADLVQFESDGAPLQQASLAVVLSGPAPNVNLEDAQTAQQEALLSLAAAVDRRARGVVVAEPATSAADRGLVSRLRADSSLAAEVSSVDNADRGVGLVAMVLALAEQGRGAAGQYGAGPRSTGPLPSPAVP
ncbi:MAG: copper transporter [Mycobacteriales bacterium]